MFDNIPLNDLYALYSALCESAHHLHMAWRIGVAHSDVLQEWAGYKREAISKMSDMVYKAIERRLADKQAMGQ